MSWEWSHTQEAYDAAETRVFLLGKKKLIDIHAEWKAWDREQEWERLNRLWLDDEGPEPEEEIWLDVYEAARTDANKLLLVAGKTALAEYVWERMKEQATCDNGGFNAWCCPYGCGCHTVSFSELEWYEQNRVEA